MADFLFFFFAAFTVICAVGVVANRNAVNAGMCLLLCLGGVAGLFVRLDAFLLAFLLLLVYAGAVVALFLFIVMLLDLQGGRRPAARPRSPGWPSRSPSRSARAGSPPSPRGAGWPAPPPRRRRPWAPRSRSTRTSSSRPISCRSR